MQSAGNYPDRMQRIVRTSTKDPNTGQDEETFTPSEYLWCRIDINAGRKQKDYGAEQTGADATINVRNWPSLSALDRLFAVEWNETWIIDRIHRGDNELILDCFRYDALAL